MYLCTNKNHTALKKRILASDIANTRSQVSFCLFNIFRLKYHSLYISNSKQYYKKKYYTVHLKSLPFSTKYLEQNQVI